MKLILPVAGYGSRLRPITHTTAKPLIPIAGKPILQRTIDMVLETQGLHVSEIILITGHLGQQIRDWAIETYDIPLRFLEQTALNGSADAIRLAEPYVNEDFLVIFPDALFDVDLEVITEGEDDGIIWTAEVEDARRFGVVAIDEDGYMTELLEKPEEPPSNLVNIGMYYVRKHDAAFGMIDVLYEKQIKAKGEYNFPEALDLMAKNGERIKVVPVEGWHDCGTFETLLSTNEEYCKRDRKENGIDKSAVIEKSTLFNCIVMQNARISASDLTHSVIGPDSIVKNQKGQLFVGSNAVVQGNDNR